MIFKDYYKILNLNTSKVTEQQIKNAFREQAKKYHPDANRHSDTAEERFKDINEAYRVLSNNSTKKKYDRTWNAKIGRKKKKANAGQAKSERGPGFGEFINILFGEARESEETREDKRGPRKGENIYTEINIKLEDAYFGTNKKISFRTIKGEMKTFSIKVPAGIRNGEKIRLIGQGKKGENGGTNGDLFIKINIEDNKKFKLYGSDLLTNVYVTPWEAALGKSIKVDSIEENVTLEIPSGVQSGEKIIIPNKGYKDGQGGRGNLVATIETVVPKEPTEQELELFKQLQEISTFNPRV